MKKNTTILTAIAAFSVLSATTAVAQEPDSVKVNSNSSQTTTIVTPAVPQQTVSTTTTISPAPARPATVAPVETTPMTNVSEKNNDDNPPLRRGEFGIRYMPTFYSLTLRDANNETIKGSLTMSHGWGVMLGFNFSRHVGIVGEVDYLQINQKFKDRSLNRTVQISYLNIPVLLSLNTNKESAVNLNFVVGPQFGLNVGSSVKTEDNGNADSLKAVVAAKPGDVGVAYGAGLEFALNKNHSVRLDLGFRGYYGLVDMRASQTNNNPDTYNVLLRASRKTYAGYIGLTFLF
jgi:hypothetical protein